MLIHEDINEKLKIYYTNKLLLIIRGDQVEKELLIGDKHCLEEELLEFKERMVWLLEIDDKTTKAYFKED